MPKFVHVLVDEDSDRSSSSAACEGKFMLWTIYIRTSLSDGVKKKRRRDLLCCMVCENGDMCLIRYNYDVAY